MRVWETHASDGLLTQDHAGHSRSGIEVHSISDFNARVDILIRDIVGGLDTEENVSRAIMKESRRGRSDELRQTFPKPSATESDASSNPQHYLRRYLQYLQLPWCVETVDVRFPSSCAVGRMRTFRRAAVATVTMTTAS